LSFHELIARTYYHWWFMLLWGACWGSFLNVVFYRYPLGRSVMTPASACPRCNRAIAFYDNIPVLAWLWLRGKCRHCHLPISMRYPLIELGFGLVFLAGYLIYPNHIGHGFSLGFLIAGLVAGTYLWVKCGRVPWYVVGTCIVAGLILVLL